MKKSFIKTIYLTLLIATLSACQGEGTRSRNPQSPEASSGVLFVEGTTESTSTAQSLFEEKLKSLFAVFSPLKQALAQNDSSVKDLNGNNIEIEQAYLGFEALKTSQNPLLSQLDENGAILPRNIDFQSDEALLDNQGPFLVDLMEPTPDYITGITISTGQPGGVHLRQANVETIADGIQYAPAGMEGFSLIIKGRFDNNSTFEFKSSENFLSASELVVSKEKTPEGVPTMRFRINLKKLMSQVILNANQAMKEGGCPTIAPNANSQQTCLLLSAEKSSAFQH